MSSTAEPTYSPGEALTLTTQEGGFPTKRAVEFLGISNGGQQAQVKFGRDTFNVPLDQLSRIEPPKSPPNMSAWLTVPKPPQPPSQDQLDERLTAARQALARSHQRVRDVQAAVDAARVIVDRASKELSTAQAALRSYDAHARSEQIALEEALRLGKPTPTRANGHDARHYVQIRTDQASQALTRFQGELATQMAAMNEALAATRKAAAEVVSLLTQQAVEGLRALETQAATVRAELLAVASHWFAGAELGPLKLPPVTASYLEAAPHWQDQPAVRLGGSEARTRPWKDLFAKLVNGDVQADFNLDQNE